MQTLAHVIVALRQEIEQALATGHPLPDGTHLQADRVVVSLQVRVRETDSAEASESLQFEVIPAGAKSTTTTGIHTVTVEFKAGVGASPATPPASAQTQLMMPTDSATLPELHSKADENIVKALSTVLGAPGFDSSARATVLREALIELSAEQIHAVVRSLYDTPLPENDTQARRARHLILGVLKSGPLHSIEGGGEILMNVFTQHDPASVLQIIATRWKDQDAWLNEA